MTAREKLLQQVLAARSDHNIQFDSLCELIRSFGFEERIRGSHHIFGKEGVLEILNLQPRGGGKAKPYQVKQVRNLLVRYRLGIENDER